MALGKQTGCAHIPAQLCDLELAAYPQCPNWLSWDIGLKAPVPWVVVRYIRVCYMVEGTEALKTFI